MQAQPALLKFTDSERQIGDRLLKLAAETDRVEGYSEPHATLMARLTETIGAQLGMHGSDLTALKFAALAHDIGERVMKRNYLLRPDSLTWEETLDLWRHPILGEQAAGELKLSRQTQLLIRWHHEWWNGAGYPDGLAGEGIPLGARILRAVDSYSALISIRPYRGRFTATEAEQVIADLAGIEFDPLIVKLLLAQLGEEKKLREPESRLIAPEPSLQVVFTPEGLQAAIIETEPEFQAKMSEPFPPAPEPELQQPDSITATIDVQTGHLEQFDPADPADLEAARAQAQAEVPTAEFAIPTLSTEPGRARGEMSDLSEAITSELPQLKSVAEPATKDDLIPERPKGEADR